METPSDQSVDRPVETPTTRLLTTEEMLERGSSEWARMMAELKAGAKSARGRIVFDAIIHCPVTRNEIVDGIVSTNGKRFITRDQFRDLKMSESDILSNFQILERSADAS